MRGSAAGNGLVNGTHFQMLLQHPLTTTPSNLATGQPLYGGLKDDPGSSSLHDPHGQCPSSWHTSADRHSPVFPNINYSYQEDHTMDSMAAYDSRLCMDNLHGGYSYHDYAHDECGYYTHEYSPNQQLASCQYQSHSSMKSGDLRWDHIGHGNTNWQIPCRMVIEGRLMINTSQSPSSCCYANQDPAAHLQDGQPGTSSTPYAPHHYMGLSQHTSNGYTYPEITAACSSSGIPCKRNRYSGCCHQNDTSLHQDVMMTGIDSVQEQLKHSHPSDPHSIFKGPNY